MIFTYNIPQHSYQFNDNSITLTMTNDNILITTLTTTLVNLLIAFSDNIFIKIVKMSH